MAVVWLTTAERTGTGGRELRQVGMGLGRYPGGGGATAAPQSAGFGTLRPSPQ